MASGSGWNLWVHLVGVVARRYIDFLILLIPTPLVSVLFCSSIPTFCSFKKNVFSFCIVMFPPALPVQYGCGNISNNLFETNNIPYMTVYKPGPN